MLIEQKIPDAMVSLVEWRMRRRAATRRHVLSRSAA
jgi:hypothetical protein